MQTLSFRTKKKEEFLDITKSISDLVSRSEVEDGACLVFVAHTTCALMINENSDPDVSSDILDSLEKIVPSRARYKHKEGNSSSHIKSALIGPEKIIPISQGKLELGRWQAICLAEFDGPRERQVYIEFLNR